jgi:hypothetical protein
MKMSSYRFSRTEVTYKERTQLQKYWCLYSIELQTPFIRIVNFPLLKASATYTSICHQSQDPQTAKKRNPNQTQKITTKLHQKKAPNHPQRDPSKALKSFHFLHSPSSLPLYQYPKFSPSSPSTTTTSSSKTYFSPNLTPLQAPPLVHNPVTPLIPHPQSANHTNRTQHTI